MFCLLSQRGWHSAPVTSQLVTHHPPPAPPPPPKPPPPKPPPPPPVVKPWGMNCKITGNNCLRATQRRKESANQKGVHQCIYIYIIYRYNVCILYIYTQRESEREREQFIFMPICQFQFPNRRMWFLCDFSIPGASEGAMCVGILSRFFVFGVPSL